MMQTQPILFITDPWDTLDHPKDTTLRWIQEALTLGMRAFWCDVKSIRWDQNQVCLDAQEILEVFPERESTSFRWGVIQTRNPSEFAAIHYRTDPPVDSSYLHPLHLLAMDPQLPEMINPLPVLFMRNEKLEAGALRGLMPPSLVSSQWNRLKEFGEREKITVLKPLEEAQSKGIHLLNWQTPEGVQHAFEIISQSTRLGETPILLQRYLPEIEQGETRLWFLDGELLASIKKLPLEGDFRVNLDRGSRLACSELNSEQLSMSQQIGDHLKQRGIRLAAVDLIGLFITDFNFTSPGLIVQMETLLNTPLARRIIQTLHQPT